MQTFFTLLILLEEIYNDSKQGIDVQSTIGIAYDVRYNNTLN